MKNQSIKYLGLALLLSAGYTLAMEPAGSKSIIEKFNSNPEVIAKWFSEKDKHKEVIAKAVRKGKSVNKALLKVIDKDLLNQWLIEKNNPGIDAIKNINSLTWFRGGSPAEIAEVFANLYSPIDLGSEKSVIKNIEVLRENPETRTIRGVLVYYLMLERDNSHKAWIEQLRVDPRVTQEEQAIYEKQLMQRAIDQSRKEYSRAINKTPHDVMTTDYGVHSNPEIKAARQAVLQKFGFTPVKEGHGKGWEYEKPFEGQE